MLTLALLALSACSTPCTDPEICDEDDDGVVAARDCDEGDPQVGEASDWVADCDEDGVAGDQRVAACETPDVATLFDLCGEGGTWRAFDEPGGDCDDFDASATVDGPWSPDCDADGTPGAPILACGHPDEPATVIACGIAEADWTPGEADPADCDDEDPLADAVSAWFPDCDGDGATGAPLDRCGAPDADDTLLACGGPGSTWSPTPSPSQDCDEDDPLADVPGAWHPDCDGDGVPGAAITACGEPDATETLAACGRDDAPWTAVPPTEEDCDDTAADVFPGAAETPGDSVDSDCDGADGGAVTPPTLVVPVETRAATDDTVTVATTSLTDVDGDALTFAWAVADGPPGATPPTLTGADTAEVTVQTPSEPGVWTISLTGTSAVHGAATVHTALVVLPRGDAPVDAFTSPSHTVGRDTGIQAAFVHAGHLWAQPGGGGAWQAWRLDDPGAPTLVGEVAAGISGNQQRVGDTLWSYTANATSSAWERFDLSDPTAPARIAAEVFTRLDGTPIANPRYLVPLDSGRLLVSDSSAWVVVVDASVPGSPVTLGEANVGQMTLGVAVGEAALFRQLDGSLYWRATVIDASNPAAPTVAYRGARVHQTRTPLARSGSDVWVSLGVNEGERWDLSDPANPVVTVLDEPILSAAPDEGGLWFNVPAGLRRWDVSTSPPVQTDLILVHERPVGRVGDLLAYRNEDLRWLDLARRPERLALSTLPFPDGTYYMEAAGTALYASQTGNDTTESLHVWDISDATAPVKTDTLAAPGSWHLTVGGGVALLNGASGLGVYDLADPLHPVLATTWLDNVGAQHAASALAGPLAATIENSDYEAVFVDFSDPYAPVRRGSVPLDVGYMIGFDGTRAWVGDGGTAQVVDFTDPDAPLTTWSDSLDPWVGWSMVIPRGDLVYAACDSNVSVIDASDPAAPTPLDLAPDWRSSDLGTGYCWDFDVDEATGLLWMPDSDFGLVAWDVSDPTFIHPAVGLPPIGDQESLEIADDGVVWVGSRTHLGAYAQPILPVLDLDLPSDEIAVGTAIDATFTWADLEDAPTNRVSCEVSAGACEVVSVDHAANSAQIAWTPAETVGIHELRVVLSDVDWFLSDSARVRAVP